jgi:O-Antigen ligase
MDRVEAGLTVGAVTVAAAVGVTVLDGGGFSPGAQTLLVLLGAVALLAAVLLYPDEVIAIARRAPVVVLIALGVLALLSATWTIGSARDSVRDGLVILAYAALAAAAGALTAKVGPAPIAVGLAALAGVEAVIGLTAAALHTLPDAERIGGSWRPGGSFQYPPALGLLQVAALPALLRGMAAEARVALPAALGASLAGAVLGCADSRLDVLLAAAVAAVLLVWPPRARDRSQLIAALALIVLAGIGGHLLLGEHIRRGASGSAGRLALVGGLCLGLAAVWPVVRRFALGRRLPRAIVVTVVVGAATVAAVGILSAAGSGGSPSRGGLAHGRTQEWKAAFETWLDRPVAGAGSGAYYQASLVHQGPSPTLYAHDLPLELAAELGALGLVLGLGLYASSILMLVRDRARLAVQLLGPAVAVFLIANLVDWPWHLAGLGAAWACALGGCLAAPLGPDPRPPIGTSRTVSV